MSNKFVHSHFLQAQINEAVLLIISGGGEANKVVVTNAFFFFFFCRWAVTIFRLHAEKERRPVAWKSSARCG